MYHPLPYGSCKYNGIVEHAFSFVLQKQLLNKNLWKSFVTVFKTKEDSDDLRWRCEYWGKMMRGACLCYQYSGNEELYKTLEETVIDLLSTQDELGRFSTYTLDKEFQSWDMWGRKYVLTALEHFYEICKDPLLKGQILKAMKGHADYIIGKVGNKEGQIEITNTSHFWLGVNSASILETIVALYRLTKEQKYLDFAEYIVNSGGVQGNNLIKQIAEDSLLPYQLVEAKAYETMSFFEGVFEYAVETKNEYLYKIAIKFFELVNDSEISVTGNAGSEDENFSHASINQIVKPERFAQETCVSVTWMRIMHKLYLYTNDTKYHERFITTALNAYYGSINFNNQSSTDYPNTKLAPLPFDSYSPLVYGRRGVATGGLNFMRDGTFYGCCTCIGSAGIGLLGLDSVLEDDKTVLINDYFDGSVRTKEVDIKISGNYLRTGKARLNIQSKKDILLRIPSWSKATITVNNKEIIINDKVINIGNGSLAVDIDFKPEVTPFIVQDQIAFKYGDIVLGLDEMDNSNIDIEEIKASDITNFKLIDNIETEIVSFEANYQNKKLIFKDYASCGKYWDQPKQYLTAFIKRS